jgi:D-alanyl-D-alanine carboxypeptidase
MKLDKSSFQQLVIYCGSLAVVILLLVLIFGGRERASSSAVEQLSENCDTRELGCPVESAQPVEDPFANLGLSAKAAIVWDISRQEALYELNSRAQLPLASLTKVMTALIAGEILPEGLIITIEPPYLEAESDDGLLADEQWRLSELIDFTLVKSSNDGALALAAVAGALGQQQAQNGEINSLLVGVERFTEAMNARAAELGLTQTYFTNGTGLDVSESTAGSYGSAYDMARLMEHVIQKKPEVFAATRAASASFTSASGFVHNVSNTNDLVNKIPGLIAGKTGYTDLAGGNLAIVFDAGPAHPISVVVLGSSLQGRFSDTEKLVWAALEKLRQESEQETD